MKKHLISGLIAIVAAVACTDRIETPAPETSGDRIVTIKASFDPETKTAYESEKYFSWVAGDKISVNVKNASNEYRSIVFTTEAGGKQAEFTGTVPEGFEVEGLAFYPTDGSFECVDYSTPAINLKYTLTADKDNPMSSIPLVGTLKDSSGESDTYDFSFKTATGILKLSFANYSGFGSTSGLVFIRTNEEHSPVSGTFTLDKNNTVLMENASESASDERVIRVTDIVEGEDRVFYLPLPVGTLPAGTLIAVQTNDNSLPITKFLKKDIPIERNRVTELPTIEFSSWKELGNGKLYDGCITDKTVVEVTIEQSLDDENQYRLVNPWNALFGEDFDSTVGDEYFYFNITDGNLVRFPKFQTGYDGIYAARYYNDDRNRVIDSEAGWPKHIQLSPMFYKNVSGRVQSYKDCTGKDMMMQIAFPGQDIIDVATGFEIAGQDESSTGAQGYIGVKVSGGSAVSKVKIVAAASESEAKTLIASADSRVVESAATSDLVTVKVPLPADAPSGKYFVVAQYLIGNSIWRTYSDKFNYENVAVDAGYTIDDIAGTYDLSFVRSDSTPGYFPSDNTVEGTSTMTIAVSDDEEKGNFMITSFMGIECDIEPIYGTLNTRTGSIVLRAGYSDNAEERHYFSNLKTSGGAEYPRLLGYVSKDLSFVYDPVELQLEAPGKLTFFIEDSNYLCILFIPGGVSFEREYLSISGTRK